MWKIACFLFPVYIYIYFKSKVGIFWNFIAQNTEYTQKKNSFDSRLGKQNIIIHQIYFSF